MSDTGHSSTKLRQTMGIGMIAKDYYEEKREKEKRPYFNMQQLVRDLVKQTVNERLDQYRLDVESEVDKLGGVKSVEENAIAKMCTTQTMNEVAELVERLFDEQYEVQNQGSRVRNYIYYYYRIYIINLFLVRVKINELLNDGNTLDDIVDIFLARKGDTIMSQQKQINSRYNIQTRIRMELRNYLMEIYGINYKYETHNDKIRKDIQDVMEKKVAPQLAEKSKQAKQANNYEGTLMQQNPNAVEVPTGVAPEDR